MQYFYSGPVMAFDNCINPKWEASTSASSEKQARNNLTFQYKRQHKLAPDSNIRLTGKIRVDDEYYE